MKSTRIILGIAVIVCALAIGLTCAGYAQERTSVESIDIPELPISIGRATRANTDNKTVLTYSLSNRSGGDVTKVNLVVFIVDPTGHIRGGEGWLQDANIPAGSTKDFLEIMKKQVAPDERLIMVAQQLTTASGTIEVSTTDLVNAVKARRGNRNHALTGLRIKRALDAGPY